MNLRVMTYNIQHCRDYVKSTRENKEYIDYDLIADAIKSQNADIVVLNEVRNKGPHPDYKNQTEILAQKTGYKYYHFGEAIRFAFSLPYGNGILSKYPIIHNEVIKIPDPVIKDEDAYYETRCIIKSVICLKDKELTVLGSHFGLANKEKINAVEIAIEIIDSINTPYILMGDFNMSPSDIKLKPIYDKMKDSADFFENEKFSFPSDKPNTKIDYIFVSNKLNILSADIPDVIASDHRPHICDIML